MLTLNKENVMNLVNSNHTAKEFFKFWSDPKRRNRDEINIDRIRTKMIESGAKVVPEEFKQTLKDLEASGIGSIVYGRNGKPDRFKPNYSLKLIGNMISHPEQEVELPRLNKVKEESSRGRPKGVKDSTPRIRRSREEMKMQGKKQPTDLQNLSQKQIKTLILQLLDKIA